MSTKIVHVCVPALLLCACAGTTYAQYVYNGASPNGSDWSRLQNWVGLVSPPIGGNTDLTATMGAAPANRRNPNTVDLHNGANPAFNLNRLAFAATANGAYDIVGSPLRFNNSAVNGGAVIAHDTNDVTHLIDNPIILNTNLRIEGTANNVNGAPTLRFDGVISQSGNINYGVTFAPTQSAMRYRVSGQNTYAGDTTLNNGLIQLTGLSNLGTGAFLSGSANANHVQTIGALSGFNAVMTNTRFEMTRNINIGLAGNAAASSLTVNGEFRPGVAANQAREVNLRGGRFHTLVLGNEIVLNNQATLLFNGDVAPTIERGRILDRRQAVGNMPASPKVENLGSLVRITGEQTAPNANNRVITSMAGALIVQNATLQIECRVGSNAARINNDWQIGAVNMPAALIGRSVINGARGPAIDPARIFFANNRGVNLKGGAILQPGASPGILALNGGAHVFEPDSSFGITLNGVLPGNGDGYSSQLLLEEGADVTLQCSQTNVRPILGVDLQTTDSTGTSTIFSPSLGMSFTVIDQDSALAPTLYSPTDQFGYGGNMFMSPDGNALSQGVYFSNEALPSGMYFQIDYYGGDTGNDVVLTIVPVPTPGAGTAVALGGLALLRRRRR